MLAQEMQLSDLPVTVTLAVGCSLEQLDDAGRQ
jgi:hypothetical protein